MSIPVRPGAVRPAARPTAPDPLAPLLDLRMRAGEGVGAALATRLLLDGLRLRAETARVDR